MRTTTYCGALAAMLVLSPCADIVQAQTRTTSAGIEYLALDNALAIPLRSSAGGDAIAQVAAATPSGATTKKHALAHRRQSRGR